MLLKTLLPLSCAIVLPLCAAAAQPADLKSATTYQAGNARTINVRDLGAVGDGSSHLLKDKFASQEEIDAFYGKDLYDLNDEMDYVAFSEALRVARSLGRPSTDPNVSLNMAVPEIYLPNGKYQFNRTIVLTNLYGCTIRGAGRTATHIEFTKKGGDLFKIVAAGELSFKAMGFISNIASMATIFRMDNISGPTGYGRPTFKIRFEEINWSGTYRCIYAEGDEMCSEVILDRCRMVNCLIGLHLDNPNALNFNLFACDFESRPDEDSIYHPFKPSACTYILVDAGGGINCFGGSVIHAGRTLYLKSKSLEQNYASGVFFNFYGVKFEQHGHEPFLFDYDVRAYSPASVNFNACSSFHSMSVAQSGKDESPNGRLGNGMSVSLENCLFAHGFFVGVIDENTVKNWGSLAVNNSRIFRYKEERAGKLGLENVHHQVSYRPAGGYKEEDAELYRKLYAAQGLPPAEVPSLDPQVFMAFDIPANDTCAVGVKRLVKEITSPKSAADYEVQLPAGATLSRIIAIGNDESQATVKVQAGKNQTRLPDAVATPAKKVVTIGDLEWKNNGTDWDGQLKFSVEAKEGAVTRIICEYF